jgi:hypothetical protein
MQQAQAAIQQVNNEKILSFTPFLFYVAFRFNAPYDSRFFSFNVSVSLADRLDIIILCYRLRQDKAVIPSHEEERIVDTEFSPPSSV